MFVFTEEFSISIEFNNKLQIRNLDFWFKPNLLYHVKNFKSGTTKKSIVIPFPNYHRTNMFILEEYANKYWIHIHFLGVIVSVLHELFPKKQFVNIGVRCTHEDSFCNICIIKIENNQ